ncbi:MAG: hypothetical protein IPQ06_01015 [Chitinophagaceae bacterium]|nr:hypothetical protein [Chitinophagaceae bacterium]
MRLFYIVSILLLSSCSNNTAVSKQLSGSDSLVINFNIPQTDSIAKTMTTTEINAIKKLMKYVGGKTSEAYKCGYDGNLMFYKKGVLTGDIAFNYSGEDCQHFIQIAGDKLSPTTMSHEAANFLKSLAEGKSWY